MQATLRETVYAVNKLSKAGQSLDEICKILSIRPELAMCIMLGAFEDIEYSLR